jgi:hypothetical protein
MRLRRPREREDLSETADFFLALKGDPEWRERLVVDLTFGRRNYVRMSSAYQVNFPSSLLEPFADRRRTRTANMLLPLTTRDKRPLLNLSTSGPSGSPATVTSRSSIAGLETLYLTALVEESPARHVLSPLIDEDLWEAICLFSPALFQGFFLKRRKDEFVPALADYLSSGLRFEVSQDRVRGWREKTKEAGDRLTEWLGEPPEPFSSSEEVLLALPDMDRLPSSIAEVDAVVDRYVDAVLTAHERRERPFLETLAEYGRRYELIIEAELPLLEPSRVRIEEDLPFRFSFWTRRFWVEQSLPLGDASSAHFEARVDDPIVEFSSNGVRVKDLAEHDGSGWLEGVRVSREAIALYTSAPERPRYLKIAVRLEVVRHVLATALALLAVNLVGIFFALAMAGTDELASKLAVVVVPTTVAATFALVREQTALASRLQASLRIAMAVSAITLWTVASVQLISAGDPETSSPSWRPVEAPQFQPAGDSQRYDEGEYGGWNGTERSKGKRKSRGREAAESDAEPENRSLDEAKRRER